MLISISYTPHTHSLLYTPTNSSNTHRANITLNADALPDPSLPLRAHAMDWGEPSSYPSSPVDVVLGSDLVYQKSIGPLLSKVTHTYTYVYLYMCVYIYIKHPTHHPNTIIQQHNTPKQVLNQLLRPEGHFLYVAPSTGRDGLPEFLAGLEKRAGLKLLSEKAAPAALLGNPLASGSEDDFLLHFHELATGEHEYRLYDFVKQ